MAKILLKPIRGDAQIVELGVSPVSIGRHPECSVPIRDERASRQHCIIEIDNAGGLIVRDLGSRNGTKVNDIKVESARLHPGDVIRVGTHEFLVELEDDGIGPPPADINSDTGAGEPDFSGIVPEPAHLPIFPEASPQAPVAADPAEPAAPAASHADASNPEYYTGPRRSATGTGASIDVAAGDWSAQLEALIDNLPPKSTFAETLTMLDASGKNSQALTGDSIGPKAMRLLLRLGSKARATDVHVEPKAERHQVRVRVDGQMITVVDLPTRVGELVFGLIKSACLMKTAARDAVQEGHFSVQFPDRRVDYRVSFTPSVFGQKLVIRILDTRGIPTSLTELGLVPYMAERVRRVCVQDHGLLLVCGPTGSGKTTTLYNALREIDRNSRNVVTIEDPVEYQLDMVTQIPTDESKGNNFSNLLRSVLRQDPDVILVGEIRDEETARTAMQAAMTGHVVFSSIHAKDTIAAVFRLLDLKVEAYLVANALDLVLAQRLVRVLCEGCRREVPVSPGQATRLGKYLGNRTRVYTATGCARCLRTGYRGRRALFELLDFTDELRDVVLREPTIAAMKKVIEGGHFTTLAQFGWRLVGEGVTTIEEVDQVAGQG